MTIKVKICPICESRNLRLSSQFDGWLVPELYICPDCGYKGPIYLEIQIDPDELSDNEE